MALLPPVKARLVLTVAAADPMACTILGVAVTQLRREHWTVEAFGTTQTQDAVALDLVVAELTREWTIDAPEVKDANQQTLFPDDKAGSGGAS